MPKIFILSQLLINKIAAGEVVERPASVVKELLENSLDAGAKRITLDVEDGGKRLIRISDDGCGMGAEDLELAFMAHATSKISRDEDLFAIRTMGFRGEALASIASVSQVEAISRAVDTIEAHRLVIEGGDKQPVIPHAAPVGTTIAVRNLFFNTPARRKFLRATATEFGHISEQFARIALPNTPVQFTLTHNGKQVYHLPADQPLRERIGMLFGGEQAGELLPVHRQDRGVEVSGLVGPPPVSRPNAQSQYIFLNGRCIRDRFIGHAIREAYRGLMEMSRFPVVYLFLTVAPDSVDVNVHPAKAEVRFADSNLMHSQVLAAIRDKLLRTDLSVPLRGTAQLQAEAEGVDLPEKPTSQEEHQTRVRQAMVDFFKNNPRSGSPSPMPPLNPRSESPTRSEPPPSQPRLEFRPAPPATPSAVPAERMPEPELPPLPPKVFMQVHNAYLVVESEDGLVIIDQHALHERIIYEQLHRRLQEGNLASQRCLIPEVVEVSPRQMAALEEYEALLAELGVFAEPFGPGSVAVQGYPAMLEKLNPANFIKDLLDILAAQTGRVAREELLHKILDMLACKAAVKAGDPLNDQEIASLLAQRHLVDRSSNCPHGRPTTLRLSKTQLEKEFRRT